MLLLVFYTTAILVNFPRSGFNFQIFKFAHFQINIGDSSINFYDFFMIELSLVLLVGLFR